MNKKTGMIKKTHTSAAYAPANLGVVCVFAVVLMASFAVSFGALSRGAHFASNSASDVFRMRDGFQMPRIHTAADSTEVVKLQTFWNETAKQFIRNAVGRTPVTLIVPDFCISAFVDKCKPEPASSVWFGGNLVEETLPDATLGSSHVTPFKSHWFGLRGGWNRSVALLNYTGGSIESLG
jgi:hypothetical protein